MSDPRKEPGDETDARTEIITGVRRKDVLRRMETLAPTPSKPPREEPGAVLDYMLALANMQRSDSAYAAARAEEATQELKDEFDGLRLRVLAVDHRLEQVQATTVTLANAQAAQNAQIIDVERKLDKMQQVFEGALSNVDKRVATVERRQDDLERKFQIFQEMVSADIAARRAQNDSAQISQPASRPDRKGD